MYIVVSKKTKEILHMSNSLPGEDKTAEELMPDFNIETMEFGRCADQYIAEKFEIKNGVVKNIEDESAIQVETESKEESVVDARLRRLQEFEYLALSERNAILPDFKLQNVALGIYDEKKVNAIRATVEAFIKEHKRLEAAVNKARSVKNIDAIEAKFPTAIVTP